jgi:hypothetical protein
VPNQYAATHPSRSPRRNPSASMADSATVPEGPSSDFVEKVPNRASTGRRFPGTHLEIELISGLLELGLSGDCGHLYRVVLRSKRQANLTPSGATGVFRTRKRL